jgi:hypothetical protein
LVKASSTVQLLSVILGMLLSSCASRIETGAIRGQVSGASGLSYGQGVLSAESNIFAVPNTNITLKNASTGIMRTMRTDSNGNFRMEGISPGYYEVAFEAKPFKRQVRGIDVRPGETTDASTRMLTSTEAGHIINISGCPARRVGGLTPTDLSSAEIKLRRTTCYGPCPAYSISLYGDGRVEYRGDRYVSVRGIRKYRVERSAVVGLARRFFEKGFFNFCASYREPVTDQPTVETRIGVAGVTKIVSVYGDAAPEGLEDLDAQVENVAHVAQLVKSAARPE